MQLFYRYTGSIRYPPFTRPWRLGYWTWCICWRSSNANQIVNWRRWSRYSKFSSTGTKTWQKGIPKGIILEILYIPNNFICKNSKWKFLPVLAIDARPVRPSKRGSVIGHGRLKKNYYFLICSLSCRGFLHFLTFHNYSISFKESGSSANHNGPVLSDSDDSSADVRRSESTGASRSTSSSDASNLKSASSTVF